MTTRLDNKTNAADTKDRGAFDEYFRGQPEAILKILEGREVEDSLRVLGTVIGYQLWRISDQRAQSIVCDWFTHGLRSALSSEHAERTIRARANRYGFNVRFRRYKRGEFWELRMNGKFGNVRAGEFQTLEQLDEWVTTRGVEWINANIIPRLKPGADFGATP